MIDSLEITNWKTHKNTSLKFQKGVNVLIGIMGAGKSSVVDAITFALFGTFPALTSKKIAISGLIMNRPSRETEAEIKLSFMAGNDKYTVTRRIGAAGNSARLDKNGSYMQTQPTKVTEEIEAALKIDYDTFSRVVYAEQNRLDYFLDLPKGERKRQIDHMLGLDTFATAEENVTSLINSIKSAITVDESALQQFDFNEIISQLKKYMEEKEAALAEKEKLAKQEHGLKSEVERIRKESELVKKQLTQKHTLSEEATKAESRINTLKEEIKKIESMKIDVEKVGESLKKQEALEKQLLKDLEELRKKEMEAAKRLATAESEYESNAKKEKERDRLVKEIKDKDESETKKELDRAQTDLQDLIKEIGLKKGRTAELDGQMRELEKHISKCPICERELDDETKAKLMEGKKAIIDMLGREIKKSEQDAAGRTSLIKKMVEAHNTLVLANKKLSEFKGLDESLEQGRKICADLKKQLDALQKDSENMNREYSSIKDALGKIRADVQTAERRKTYESEVKEASAKLDAKRKEIGIIKVDDKMLYELQERLTEQSSSLSEVSSKLESGQKYIANLEFQIKDKEKRMAEYGKIEKSMERRRSQTNNLNKFKLALLDTEAFLRNRLVSSINGTMQNLWPKLYPYGDYLSIRLNAKKDDYLLEIDTAGSEESWIPVDGIASGGERSIGCLAMRIALAMVVVPNLKWLILDEPTHNLDNTGISKLIEILGESLPSVVEQIFIITHDDNLKQIAAARIYQFDRDKGVSAPTAVSII
jgi:exonuclease SbcC